MNQPQPIKVFKFKMNQAVAAYTARKDVVGLVLPLVFAPGDRLWMVECGPQGRTGRADLCRVIGRDRDRLLVYRGFCWQSNKLDDDLAELNLTVLPDSFNLLEDSVIPPPQEKMS